MEMELKTDILNCEICNKVFLRPSSLIKKVGEFTGMMENIPIDYVSNV